MLRILGANFDQTSTSNTDISALKSRKAFSALSVNHWDLEDLYQLQEQKWAYFLVSAIFGVSN